MAAPAFSVSLVTAGDEEELLLRVRLRERAPASGVTVEWWHSASWIRSERRHILYGEAGTTGRIRASQATQFIVRACFAGGKWSPRRVIACADLPVTKSVLRVVRWDEEAGDASPVLVLFGLSPYHCGTHERKEGKAAEATAATKPRTHDVQPASAASHVRVSASLECRSIGLFRSSGFAVRLRLTVGTDKASGAPDVGASCGGMSGIGAPSDNVQGAPLVIASVRAVITPAADGRVAVSLSFGSASAAHNLVASQAQGAVATKVGAAVNASASMILAAAVQPVTLVADTTRLLAQAVVRRGLAQAEQVSTSMQQSVSELASSAASRTIDAALALRARASQGGRRELLLEQYEMSRRLPRGAPPAPNNAAACLSCVAEGKTHAQAAFGITRHRHHCAHCGGARCAPHLQWRRPIDHKFATGGSDDAQIASGHDGGGGADRYCGAFRGAERAAGAICGNEVRRVPQHTQRLQASLDARRSCRVAHLSIS